MHLNTAHAVASKAARRNKIVSVAEAVRLIHDGDTVATSGFVGIGFAEGIAIALEQRFLATEAETGLGAPRGLTLVYAAGQGDGKRRGLNHFGHRVCSSASSAAIGGWCPRCRRSPLPARSRPTTCPRA
jgi:propionate CoA-transferase